MRNIRYNLQTSLLQCNQWATIHVFSFFDILENSESTHEKMPDGAARSDRWDKSDDPYTNRYPM